METGDRAYDTNEGLEKVYDGSNWIRTPQSDNARFTDIGGLAILLTNKTGAASVKGSLVKADTAVDNAFILTAADDQECIGVVFDDGVADGNQAWVVIFGIAQVLLKDTTASTRGNWIKTSDTAGRADATLAAPPGGGVTQLDEHMQEVGHCMESKGSGTDVLARAVLHFN
jgi:hypothetical protein